MHTGSVSIADILAPHTQSRGGGFAAGSGATRGVAAVLSTAIFIFDIAMVSELLSELAMLASMEAN